MIIFLYRLVKLVALFGSVAAFVMKEIGIAILFLMWVIVLMEEEKNHQGKRRECGGHQIQNTDSSEL